MQRPVNPIECFSPKAVEGCPGCCDKGKGCVAVSAVEGNCYQWAILTLQRCKSCILPLAVCMLIRRQLITASNAPLHSPPVRCMDRDEDVRIPADVHLHGTRIGDRLLNGGFDIPALYICQNMKTGEDASASACWC